MGRLPTVAEYLVTLTQCQPRGDQIVGGEAGGKAAHQIEKIATAKGQSAKTRVLVALNQDPPTFS